MILLSVKHGLRAGEVCSLTLDSIANGVLTVARLKGSLKTSHQISGHRGQPLLNEEALIKSWLKIRPKDAGNALFPSAKGGCMTVRQFERLFRRYAELSGIPENKRHPHLLKHTCASLLVKAGVDIAHVQKYVGHASIGSTQKYVHLADSDVTAKANDAFMSIF